MIKRVLGICPVHLKYTDKMPGDWVGGYAKMFMVRIREKYRNDKGILEHELEHVRQWYRPILGGALITALGSVAMMVQMAGDQTESTLLMILTGAFVGACVHPLLYKFVKKYKLWAEVSAYKVQNDCYPDDRTDLFAGFIAIKYKLEMSKDEILKHF